MGKKPNFNPSLLSNLVSKSLFCSHFSFSHPPLLVPCSPFPVLVTSQCFTVTCDQGVKLPNFTFYGGLEHMTTIFFFNFETTVYQGKWKMIMIIFVL